jgi:hypothetical protein
MADEKHRQEMSPSKTKARFDLDDRCISKWYTYTG